MRKLKLAFYKRDPVTVAKELLGKWIVHKLHNQELIGKIVEVEAYLGPHDLAAHSSKGLTARTKVLYGPPGKSYVYLIYGMYHCVNVVTSHEGSGSAVLIRAIEPIKNIVNKTQGPGLLCKAMHIDKKLNGADLLSADFFIASPTKPEKISIVKKPRVGVDYSKHWAKRLLRFYIKGSPFVSKR